MDTEKFIIHVKTEDVYEDIPNDAGKRFDTSNYEVNKQKRTLTKCSKSFIRY